MKITSDGLKKTDIGDDHMSLETIKKLVWSSSIVSSFRNKTFQVFDSDGFTEEASMLSVVVIVVIGGIAGWIELGG